MKLPLMWHVSKLFDFEWKSFCFVLFLDSGPTCGEYCDSHLLEKSALRLHISAKQGWGIIDALIQGVRRFWDNIFPGRQSTHHGRSQQIPWEWDSHSEKIALPGHSYATLDQSLNQRLTVDVFKKWLGAVHGAETGSQSSWEDMAVY